MSQRLTLSVMQITKHTKGAMIQSSIGAGNSNSIERKHLQKIKISKDYLPYLSFDDALLCLDERFFEPIITTQLSFCAPRLFSFVEVTHHISSPKMEFKT